MCQIDLDTREAGSPILVVPIVFLAFDRRLPISRDVAEFRRRLRAENKSGRVVKWRRSMRKAL